MGDLTWRKMPGGTGEEMFCFGWVDLPYVIGEFDEISFKLGGHTFGSDHGIKGRRA